MKQKSLCLLSALALFLLSHSSFAQIVISEKDVFQVGMKHHVTYDGVPLIQNAGPSGANQIWDFSVLQQFGGDTIEVVSDAASPFPGSLPADRFLLRGGGQFGIYGMQVNPTQVLTTGDMDQTGQIILDYQPPLIEMNLPMHYGDSLVNVEYEWDLEFYLGQQVMGLLIDTIRRHKTVRYEYRVDAWGILITPNDTFQVLRQNIYKHYFDTSDFYVRNQGWLLNADISDSDYREYLYWTKNGQYPVARLRDYGDVGLIQETEYITTEIDQNPLSILADRNKICSGDSILLIAQGSDQYVWLDSLDQFISIKDTLYLSPTQSGILRLVGLDINSGTFDTVAFAFDVIDRPDTKVTLSEDTVIQGMNVTAFGSGADHYDWIYGTFNFPLGSGDSIILTPSFFMDVVAIGYAEEKLCFEMDTAYINVSVPLAIDDATRNENRIIISPNPVKYNFEITGLNQGEEYFISDLEGRIVYSNKHDPDRSVNIEHLTKGIYIIQSGERNLRTKFYKE